jgi:hypothetical protein
MLVVKLSPEILFSMELVSLSITKLSPFVGRFFTPQFTNFCPLFLVGKTVERHYCQPLDSKLQTTVVPFVGKWITASVIHLSTKKQPEHYAPTKPEAYQTI